MPVWDYWHRIAQWLADYTHMCAVDYLERHSVSPGVWRVSVWRTGTTRQGQGKHICSIRFRWEP